MKKRFLIAKKTVALASAMAMVIASGAGCKKSSNEQVINLNVPNGGYGIEWINEIISDWEAENEGWKIELTTKKTPISTFTADVETGGTTDVFYASGVEFQDGIYKDLFADLSEILDMKVDGDNGPAIREKIMDFNAWKQAGSKNGQGFYIMPWTDALAGMIYDHDLFVEKGWLNFADPDDEATAAVLAAQGITYEKAGRRLKFVSATGEVNYEAGDYILSAGKDGKYGTYDDGQPQTLAEFDEMVRLIAASNAYPFLWAGKQNDYTTPVFSSLFANYDGEESFRTFFNYDGSYTFEGDTEPTTITKENGYKVYEMTGIKKALEFMQTYLNNTAYVHPASTKSSTSHTDAQGYFLTGYKGSAQNLQSGFLCEGVWWEAEAVGTFKSIANDKGRGYGERDYRFLVFPSLPGQKGADGNGNGTIFASYDTSGFVVVNNKNEEKLAKIKEFCAYTLKDKYLRRFTVLSGTKRPYTYALTSEDLSEMTPFARSAMQLYNDTENIKILRPKLLNLSTPISFGSSKGTASMWYSVIDNVNFGSPITALQAASGSDKAQICYNGYAAYYTKEKWERFIKESYTFMGN